MSNKSDGRYFFASVCVIAVVILIVTGHADVFWSIIAAFFIFFMLSML
jgi:hypothetical protein